MKPSLLKETPWFSLARTAGFFLAVLAIGVWGEGRLAAATNSTSAKFLTVPIGARPMALGQAFSALSYNIDSLNWNPGGLAHPSQNSEAPYAMSFTHQTPFYDTNLNQFGVTALEGNMGFGLNLIRLSYPQFDARDDGGINTGTFNASDTSLGAAFGYNFHFLQVGLQSKWVQQQLADETAQGFAFDVGLMSQTPVRRLSLGASARNIGPQMKFVNQSYSLPLSLSLGGLYTFDAVNLTADLQSLPNSDQLLFCIGTEVKPADIISLRVGYQRNLMNSTSSSYDSSNQGDSLLGIEGLSGGLGIHFHQIYFDYASAPFGAYGQTNSITLSIRFGESAPAAPEKPAERKPAPTEEPGRSIIIINPNDDPAIKEKR